jgi:membrane associated rhomboid family serine protease
MSIAYSKYRNALKPPLLLAEKQLMLIPLGLGLRFPRLPILTLVLAFGLVCLFLVDLPNARRIEKRTSEIVASQEMIEVRKQLLVEYCAVIGGSKDLCSDLQQVTEQTTQHAKQTNAPTGELKSKASERFVLSPKFQRLDTELTKKTDRVRSLKSFAKYEALSAKAKDDLAELHQKYHLFSVNNPTLRAFLLSQFRHAGWLHLAGNIFALIAFGAYVELRMGGLVYLLTYLLGGVLGIGGIVLTTSTNIHIVGASANISAVMGAFFIAFLQYRMKFMVVTLVGVRSFFGQVSIFFPIIYLLSESVAFLESSSHTFTGGVANGAHLIGLAIGMIIGTVDRKTTRIHWPFIYPGEAAKTMALQKLPDTKAQIQAAESLLQFNPENVYARLFVLGEICYAEGPMTPESTKFLQEHMSACASVQIRRGKTQAINETIDALAVTSSFPKIFATLDSKNLIKLADKALDEDNLLLAIRLFDCYVQRFPKTRMAAAVQRTVSEILKHIDADAAMRAYVQTYIAAHPAHKLPIAAGQPLAPEMPAAGDSLGKQHAA